MPPSRSSTWAKTGGSRLLNLPVELFRLILETIIREYGVGPAMCLRYVCHAFDNEVVQSICNLQCFERPTIYHKRYQHENLTHRYLYARTVSARADKHHITQVIKDSVNYMIQECPELEACRDEFVYKLCLCVVQISGAPTIDAILTSYHDFNTPMRTKTCRVTPMQNALSAAAYLGLTPVLQRLLGQRFPNKTVSDFGQPLNCAIAGGHKDVVQLLLSQEFTLSEAAYPQSLTKNHGRILRMLVDRIPDPTPATLRATILRATTIGDYNTIIHYVEHLKTKAEQLGTDQLWQMPLELWATTKTYKSSFYSLFNCMLYVAADHGYIKLVDYSLDNGAYVDCRPTWSMMEIRGVLRRRSALSPLEIAAKRGHLDIVRLLLERGATSTQKALNQAALSGWLEISRTLLDTGANLWPAEAEPDCGFDYFPEIVQRGHAEIARLYLHCGFNKRTKKHLKERAAAGYRIAQQDGSSEILELMREYVYDSQSGMGFLRMEHIAVR